MSQFICVFFSIAQLLSNAFIKVINGSSTAVAIVLLIARDVLARLNYVYIANRQRCVYRHGISLDLHLFAVGTDVTLIWQECLGGYSPLFLLCMFIVWIILIAYWWCLLKEKFNWQTFAQLMMKWFWVG